MAKIPKKEADKKYFDKYKNTNRKEINKQARQERQAKRIEKLKARSAKRAAKKKDNSNNNEQLKNEEYVPHRFNKEERKAYRVNKRKNYMVDDKSYGWWKSLFDKLDFELRKEEKEEKKVLGSLKSNKGKVTIEERREENGLYAHRS